METSDEAAANAAMATSKGHSGAYGESGEGHGYSSSCLMKTPDEGSWQTRDV
jgi:hypothetical protein